MCLNQCVEVTVSVVSMDPILFVVCGLHCVCVCVCVCGGGDISFGSRVFVAGLNWKTNGLPWPIVTGNTYSFSRVPTAILNCFLMSQLPF